MCAGSIVILSACSKDNEEPAPGNGQTGLAFEVEVGLITDYAAVVSVSPEVQDAEWFSYIFKASDYAADSTVIADSIQRMAKSEEYAEYRNKGTAQLAFCGLEADTDYVVCAASVEGGKYSGDISAFRLTTDQLMEHLEVTETPDVLDWGQEYGNTNATFTVRFGNAELNQGEYFDYFASGSLALLECVRELTSLEQVPENMSAFVGSYASKSAADIPGNVNTENLASRLEIYDETGSHTNDQAINDAQISIVPRKDGTCALVAEFTTADSRTFSSYYDGDFRLSLNGYYGIYNYSPSLQEDLVGLDYPLMRYAYYSGEENDMSKYSLAFVHDPDPESSYGGNSKHCIKLQLYVPTQSDPYGGIPAGTYPISAEPQTSTTIAGDYRWYDAISIDLLGSFYFYLDEETYEQTTGFMRSGFVKVDRDGEEYVFTVDAETWDGYKISGTSTQSSLEIVDEPLF